MRPSASAMLARMSVPTRTRPRTEMGGEVGGDTGRAFGIDVDDRQRLDPEHQRRMRDGGARAAGAELDDAAQGHVRHLAPKRLEKAGPIRVVSDPRSVPEQHRVHGAERPGILRQFVEKGDHRLLAGMGDVEAVIARPLGRLQKIGQSLDAEFELREVHQAVDEAQALRLPLAHLHLRGARGLDVLSDQAQEDRSACGVAGHRLSPSAPRSEAMWRTARA